jgi:teichuronic acid biosynthesis glycosyltransferase TuaC
MVPMQSIRAYSEGQRAPVRLLTLTSLFPNAGQPRHGIFIANRLRRICDTGRVTSTVIAGIPWFPGAYRKEARALPAEQAAGFEVFHPRYLKIPRVGMRVQPDSLANAILRELHRRKLDANAFDVIDAHYFYPDGVAAARVAKALRRPLVISARGSDINLIGDMPVPRERMLEAARSAQALIAVSGALAQKMEAMGMPGDRLHVLRNGVDMEAFAPHPRVDARRRMGLAETGALVLGVGNLVDEKNFELVIHAVAQMPGVRLLIVGQGARAGALRALADAVAAGRVEWRDNMPQAELRYAYAAANVLALPSLREGWPNVLLEAIACGTPVVAADVGGVPEIIRGDAPGTVVSQHTAAAWATALGAMLEAALPAEHVRRYARQFGWDEVVTRQCALYEDVAHQREAIAGDRHTTMAGAHA